MWHCVARVHDPSERDICIYRSTGMYGFIADELAAAA